MFMLYALLIGLAVGLLVGGRLDGVAALRVRWAPLLVGGLVAQVVLFSEPVTARVGELGPLLYVASTLAAAVAIFRNWAVPGMSLVAAGASCNLVAIIANGGYMPASPEALAALYRVEAAGYSNSALVPDPALPWLTDMFAMPAWLPGANIFSVGDVLIVAGIATVIALAMRRHPAGTRGAPAQ
ncbi:MAG: hypothetical protein A2V85_12655 [Chloroflexi bacterium RBG_16_72_14]|nr:MAG: hypothetical protein A2V85_12655 [Chloroflexi bacterium RBG_16_72_14]